MTGGMHDEHDDRQCGQQGIVGRMPAPAAAAFSLNCWPLPPERDAPAIVHTFDFYTTMSTPLTAERLPAPHTLPGWIKQALIAIGVVVACWGGAIVWWRVSARVPGTREWMSLLFGLPSIVLLAGFIGRHWMARRAAAPAASISATRARSSSAAQKPPQAQHVAVLATALRAPHGASADELAAAIADNKARPDLDRALVDADGFPVMCARCPDAHDDALREDVADWFAAHGIADPHFSDEQWPALTLASAVASELAGRAAIEWIVRDDAVPRLQVLPLLPPAWSKGQRDAAAAWLRHTVAQVGWQGQIGQAAADADPAAGMAQLAAIVAAGDQPCVTLAVACASHVGAGTVARWALDRTLFTATRPQGMMPGEGAAGLLLAGASDGGAVALLAPLEQVRDDAAADVRRRGDARVLKALVDGALARAHVAAADVGMIVADTGHRSRYVLELMEYASATLRQLDGSADVVRVGAAGGYSGIVSFVTALALASHYAVARQAPVLCIANEMPGRRLAALVRPAV